MPSLRQSILWRRARDYLAAYHPYLIAVTGTSGQPTTAAAIAHVLGSRRAVRAGHAADSSPLAVALAILGSPSPPDKVTWYGELIKSLTQELREQEPEVLVLSLPVARPGDLDWLGRRLRPDMTVVTTIGSANLELFSSQENIAHECASLIVATKDDGWVVVNHDDELTQPLATLSKSRALFYGLDPASDIRLTRSIRQPSGGFALEIALHQARAEVNLPRIIARQQLPSLLAALAAGHVFNIPLPEAAQLLHSFHPPPGSIHLVNGKKDTQIIDDSSTSTPESLKMSLETLRALPARRRIAIIGDLANLGRHAEIAHRQIGRLAAHIANPVIVVGEHMRWAGMEALQSRVDVHHFQTADDAGKWLLDWLQAGDTILVSGGANMHMHHIVDRLHA